MITDGKEMSFIPLTIVGQELWFSQHIFNPNAYPTYVRGDVNACAAKLSLIEYSLKTIQKEIQYDKSKFIYILINDKAFMEFVPDPGKPVIAFYYSVNFQAGLQSFFISIKSLLDIFTKIISRLIEPGSNLRGFGKRKVDGMELAGGILLRWLNQNAPNTYANKTSLITTVISNIDEWISDVVIRRDEIVHYGILSNVSEMLVPLSKPPSLIKEDEIMLPSILRKDHPVDLIEYCQEILENISHMLKKTVILLPNIDFSLLDLS